MDSPQYSPLSDPDVFADRAIVARLREGDQAAFRVLLDAYYEKIVSLAYHYVRVTESAQDLAQDVFVQLWDRRTTLDGNTTFGSLFFYLRQAVRHAALDVLKRERTRERLDEAGHAITTLEEEPDSPLSAMMREELRAQIRLAIGELPPRVRDCATLYFERGFTPAEIAEILGVAPPTVYTHLRKAFRDVTHALKPGSAAS